MENEQRQLIKKYIDLILFRWRLISLCLLVTLVAGLTYYLRMPKVYSAFVLLSYEQQHVNPARMAPEETRRLRDTVATLGDIVTSRNNLESLVLQFDLYAKARQKLPIEDVIENMRKKYISISPSSRGDTFRVAFGGENQDKVLKVANALGAKFIEENLKYREERATETSKYTEDELNMAKEVLDEKELAMRDYKLKYYNELPEQRAGNVTRLNSLHEQYQGIQESIQELERTKIMVQEQIGVQKQLAVSALSLENRGVGARTADEQPMTNQQRLQQMQAYLETLLSRYTEKHPEVKLTRKKIASLQETLGAGDLANTGEQTSIVKRPEQQVLDPEIHQLQLQLKDISLTISSLKKDQQSIKKDIAQYEKWIAAAPVREAEWNALTRDYKELRRHYDYLVAQNLQAESVEHLERKQKGSKFKIVDPARYPEKPIRPDFKKIIVLAAGLGLALGLGITFGLDFVDTSFKDPADIVKELGLTVSTAVPYLENKKEVLKRKFSFVIWACFILICYLALAAAIIYFWKQGRIII